MIAQVCSAWCLRHGNCVKWTMDRIKCRLAITSQTLCHSVQMDTVARALSIVLKCSSSERMCIAYQQQAGPSKNPPSRYPRLGVVVPSLSLASRSSQKICGKRPHVRPHAIASELRLGSYKASGQVVASRFSVCRFSPFCQPHQSTFQVGLDVNLLSDFLGKREIKKSVDTTTPVQEPLSLCDIARDESGVHGVESSRHVGDGKSDISDDH